MNAGVITRTVSVRNGYVALIFIFMSFVLVLISAKGRDMNGALTGRRATTFDTYPGTVREKGLKSKRSRRSLLFAAFNDASSANTTYASFDIDSAILHAQKTTNLIYQRFEFWHPKRYLFFLYSMNLPTWTWDILKYKLALKVLLPIGAQAKSGGAGSNAASIDT